MSFSVIAIPPKIWAFSQKALAVVGTAVAGTTVISLDHSSPSPLCLETHLHTSMLAGSLKSKKIPSQTDSNDCTMVC